MELNLLRLPVDTHALITRYLTWFEIDILARQSGCKALERRLYSTGGVKELIFTSMPHCPTFQPQHLDRFSYLSHLSIRLTEPCNWVDWIAKLPSTLLELDFEFANCLAMFLRPVTDADAPLDELLFSDAGYMFISVQDMFPGLRKLRLETETVLPRSTLMPSINRFKLQPPSLKPYSIVQFNHRMAMRFLLSLPDSIIELELSCLLRHAHHSLENYASYVTNQPEPEMATEQTPYAPPVMKLAPPSVVWSLAQLFAWPTSLLQIHHDLRFWPTIPFPPRIDQLESYSVEGSQLAFFGANCVTSPSNDEILLAEPSAADLAELLPTKLSVLSASSWWKPIYTYSEVFPASLVTLHLRGGPATFSGHWHLLPPNLTSLDIVHGGTQLSLQNLPKQLKVFRLRWIRSIESTHLKELPKTLETLALVDCDALLLDIHMKDVPRSLTKLRLETNKLLTYRCLDTLPSRLLHLELLENENFADEHIARLPRTLEGFKVRSLKVTFNCIKEEVVRLDANSFIKSLLRDAPTRMRDWNKMASLIAVPRENIVIETLPASLTELDLTHLWTYIHHLPSRLQSMCPKLTSLTAADKSVHPGKIHLPPNLTSLSLPLLSSTAVARAINNDLPHLTALEVDCFNQPQLNLAPPSLTSLTVRQTKSVINMLTSCEIDPQHPHLRSLHILSSTAIVIKSLPAGLTHLEIQNTTECCAALPAGLIFLRAPTLTISVQPPYSPLPPTITSLEIKSFEVPWSPALATLISSRPDGAWTLPRLRLADSDLLAFMGVYGPNLKYVKLLDGLNMITDPISLLSQGEMPKNLEALEILGAATELPIRPSPLRVPLAVGLATGANNLPKASNLAVIWDHGSVLTKLNQTLLKAPLPALTSLHLDPALHIHHWLVRRLPHTLTHLNFSAHGFLGPTYAQLPRSLTSLRLHNVRKFHPKHARKLPPGLTTLLVDTNRIYDRTLGALPTTLLELTLPYAVQITPLGFTLLPSGIRYLHLGRTSPILLRPAIAELKLPASLRKLQSDLNLDPLLDRLFSQTLGPSGAFAASPAP